MIIYIDKDYKCHITNDGAMTVVETEEFYGKCPAYIEGYRLVPEGATWIREDGVEFRGEMVAPWMPYEELAAAQATWEHEEFVRMQAEIERLKADNAAQEADNADMAEALALLGYEEVTANG